MLSDGSKNNRRQTGTTLDIFHIYSPLFDVVFCIRSGMSRVLLRALWVFIYEKSEVERGAPNVTRPLACGSFVCLDLYTIS